jgi:alkyl hydroperoxide reductase subunit AhpF
VHLLEDRDADAVRRHLAPLTGPVRLVYFTEGSSGLIIPGHECLSCGDTQRLLEDVARCSDRLTLEIHDRLTDAESFNAYGIARVPGLAVIGAQDYGIRYYGMPAGYELRTLLEMIVDVDRGAADLSAETRAALAALPGDVHVQVLVTPT